MCIATSARWRSLRAAGSGTRAGSRRRWRRWSCLLAAWRPMITSCWRRPARRSRSRGFCVRMLLGSWSPTPQEVRAISHARVKSDRFDAATLARLLSADMLAAVWVCDERIGALRRRLARRAALVRQRTRAKNEVHAVISRCLLGRPPVSDLFGKAGRAWLAGHELAEEEQETVEGCLRQIDFLDAEIALVDGKVAQFVLGSADAQRLMTIPGIDVTTAAALVAAIGDIARFASPRQLVAYLGLDPKVRQSGHGACPSWPDLQARRCTSTLRARRGGVDRDAHRGAAARLRRTHPRPPRRADRGRRRRAQDRHDRLAHALQGPGLRFRAAHASPGRSCVAWSGSPGRSRAP